MLKNKSKTTKTYTPVVFVAILVFVVISIFAYSSRNKFPIQKQTTTLNNVSTGSVVSPVVVNPMDDGVFVKTEYGFQFNYPKDIFKYKKVYGNYTFWTNLPFKEQSGDIDRSGAVLSAGLESNSSGYLGKAYDILQSLKQGQSSTLLNTSVVTKLSDIKSEQLKITTFYYGSIPYAEVDEVHVYIASWKENNNLYAISLSTNSLEKLRTFKDVFEDIVKSIKPTH